MKKLVLVLSIVFVTMSSFHSITEVEEAGCFDECNGVAAAMVSIFGGGNEAEFAWFAICYDGCAGSDGEVVFPSGNVY